MEKEEILNRVIADGSWFDNIDKEHAAKLVDLSFVKNFKTGEFVYMAGDEQESIFFLFDGQIKISIIDEDGEEFMLAVWEAEKWFGEAAFVKDRGMPVEVSVTRDSKILVVPIKIIENVLGHECSMTLYKNVMLDMVARSKLMYQLIDSLIFKPLNARVAVRMLHLIENYGEENENGVLLPLKFSQAEFARMCGGSRQRVNQVFRKWADDDIVSKVGPNYIVHDVAALQAQVDSKS